MKDLSKYKNMMYNTWLPKNGASDNSLAKIALNRFGPKQCVWEMGGVQGICYYMLVAQIQCKPVDPSVWLISVSVYQQNLKK